MSNAVLSKLAVLAGAALWLVSPSVAAQEAPRTLQLTEIARVSAEDENLSRLGGAALGPRGILAIGQPQDRSVILFDSLGRRIVAFGRKGGGPGEFESISRLGWLGDSLWIYDRTNRRVTLASANGKLLRAWPLTSTPALPAGDPNARFVQVYPHVLREAGGMTGSATLPPSTSGGEIESWIVALGPSGNVSRRLVRLPADPCLRKGTQIQVRLPLCASPLWEIFPGGERIGIVTGGQAPGMYRLAVRNSAGTELWSHAAEVVLRPVAPSLRDSLRRVIEVAPPPTATLLRSAPFPRSHPPAVGLVGGEDGTAWVRLGGRDPNGKVLWDVWGANGERVGRVRLDSNLFPIAVRQGQLIAMSESADGLQDIVAFRVR
jgi:hypothetical protein